MSSFSDYAPYYDLFYSTKDYNAEAAFVLNLLRDHHCQPEKILELGCGTGGHARHFAEAGCSLLGVDLSASMVARARERCEALPIVLREKLSFVQGDACAFVAPRAFDTVVSLFHVASYQTTNQALSGFFRSASSALLPGGLFVFDFWYGPAVLTDKPQAKMRQEIAKDGTLIVRRTRPSILYAENVVDVNYTFELQGGQSVKKFEETHSMRYLFLPEIRMFAETAGLAVEEHTAWINRGPLTDQSWYGCVVLRKLA